MKIRRAIPLLPADDLNGVREFYSGFLGFEVAMDEPGFMQFQSSSHPAVQIIVGNERGVDVANVTVDVEDVDALHAEAVRRGLEIVYPLTDEPWGIRRFFVRAPNGTVVNVASPR